MKRYWVSWWSGEFEEDGCTPPPFRLMMFCTGHRGEDDAGQFSLCLLVESQSADDVWQMILRHYPDAELRFCDETAEGLESDRFPGRQVWRIGQEVE